MEEQETVVPGAIEAEKRLLGSLMTQIGNSHRFVLPKYKVLYLR